MKFVDDRGLQTSRWVPNVLLMFDDINRIGQDTYNNLTALLATMSKGIKGTEANDVVVSGLDLTHTVDMTTKIDAGMAVSYTGRYLSGSSWEFVPSSGEVFSVVVGDNQNIAFLAGGASARIDTVEVRPVSKTFDIRNRNFKDPVTKLISTSTIETKIEYGYEFAVRVGTEGAGVAPTSNPGWIKIAEVAVGASVTALTQNNIYNVDRSELWTTESESTTRWYTV